MKTFQLTKKQIPLFLCNPMTFQTKFYNFNLDLRVDRYSNSFSKKFVKVFASLKYSSVVLIRYQGTGIWTVDLPHSMRSADSPMYEAMVTFTSKGNFCLGIKSQFSEWEGALILSRTDTTLIRYTLTVIKYLQLSKMFDIGTRLIYT